MTRSNRRMLKWWICWSRHRIIRQSTLCKSHLSDLVSSSSIDNTRPRPHQQTRPWAPHHADLYRRFREPTRIPPRKELSRRTSSITRLTTTALRGAPVASSAKSASMRSSPRTYSQCMVEVMRTRCLRHTSPETPSSRDSLHRHRRIVNQRTKSGVPRPHPSTGFRSCPRTLPLLLSPPPHKPPSLTPSMPSQSSSSDPVDLESVYAKSQSRPRRRTGHSHTRLRWKCAQRTGRILAAAATRANSSVR